jgi:hypothetical protein
MSASGRRLLQDVNVEDYIRQAAGRDDFWARLARIGTPSPPILFRLKALYNAGLLDLERDLRRFQEKTGSGGAIDGQKPEMPAPPSPEPGPVVFGKKATGDRH